MSYRKEYKEKDEANRKNRDEIRYLMSLICCLPLLIAQFLTELQQSEISATKEK